MESVKLRILFLQLFLVLVSSPSIAQRISNIRAEQRGQEIVVLYSLETTSPCEVSLLLSQDNGVTWSTPLKNVSGDVGNKVSSGDKQIIWKVLEEQEQLVGEKNIFKIFANYDYLFNPEMVFIEGGTFQMGSNSGEENEKPVHAVTLSSFNIGKYEITQAQWKAVMGSNPSHFKDCDECPVESVSWNDVQVFIQKLNERNGSKYRLPTEAEWEYAARGGQSNKGFDYSGSNDINSVAWYKSNCGNTKHIIGSRQPNELGLCDMSGSMSEWCQDIYGGYSSDVQANPIGELIGDFHVIRGGGFQSESNGCRSSARTYESGQNNSGIGFRLILPPTAKHSSFYFDSNQPHYYSEMPRYPGGDSEMAENLWDNFSYPELAKSQNIEGKVIVRLRVEKDGTLSNLNFEGNEVFKEATLAACMKLNKFIPAKQYGEAVGVCLTIPINISIEDDINYTKRELRKIRRNERKKSKV